MDTHSLSGWPLWSSRLFIISGPLIRRARVCVCRGGGGGGGGPGGGGHGLSNLSQHKILSYACATGLLTGVHIIFILYH